VFNLVEQVIQRAQRRTAGVRINTKATLSFPNGLRKRIITPDIFFGDIPITFADRTSYGMMAIAFKTGQISFI
jgi:hypothetical protein